MKKNLSDKEIRDTINNRNIVVDYFRSPQKHIFIVSLCGLILCTFAQIPISIKSTSECASVVSDLNYTDFLNLNMSFDVYLLNSNICFMILTLDSASYFILVIQFVVLFVLFIMAFTCWKGNFFKKLIQNTIRRYIFILNGTIFYIK